MVNVSGQDRPGELSEAISLAVRAWNQEPALVRRVSNGSIFVLILPAGFSITFLGKAGLGQGSLRCHALE